MKKFIPLAFLCFIFLSASCSKDSSEEGNEKNAKELIIGKWNFIKVANGDNESDFADCQATPSFNFYNNGTVVRGYCGRAEYDGEYLVSGDLLELEHDTPYSGGIDRMRATIERITSEEMILDVEDGYFDNTTTIKLYLEKAN